MNITVVQFRTDQSGPHEVKCLYNVCGVPYSSFTFIHALHDDWDAISIDQLKKHTDLWLILGWGEAGYESTDPFWIEKLEIAKNRIKPLILDLVKEKLPLVGICFGFQIMTDALGGKLEVRPDMSEGGIFDVTLTNEGRGHELFTGMADMFKGVMGHKTSVVALPKDAIVLARSQKCPIQAAQFSDRAFGFTFHPELSHHDLVERIKLYQDYVQDQKDMEYFDVQTARIMRNIIEMFSNKSKLRKKEARFSSHSL